MATVMPDITSSKDMYNYLAKLPHVKRIREGDLEPGSWLTVGDGEEWGSWGVKAIPGRRGLTLMDINKADPVEIPEEGYTTRRARGTAVDPSVPEADYPVRHRYEVWADNVESLYEEAVSRQWSAASDIPWTELEPLPRDLERAFCQLLTFFAGSEYLANDTLGPWIAKMSTAYHEVKMFLATQVMDEARHSEVFRKRVLANGGGLGFQFSAAGTANRDSGISAGWMGVSYGLHVFFEGVVLDMFRYAEFLGKTPVDKLIFQRVMQDEARHVSYGTMHLKYFLERTPELEDEILKLHAVADRAEIAFTTGFLMNPSIIQALAILAGNGVTGMAAGYDAYRALWSRVYEEYIRRCQRAGFDRASRCLMPAEAPI